MEQKINKNNIILLVLIILYAIFTLILVLHHEIWRDEAQAWLIARDLDLKGIFYHVRTEGHPLLWYAFLLPLAKLHHGFNAVLSMQILNWFLTAAGAAFFVYKAPFNLYLKVSLLLSSGFLYWYPVFARSYCFIPLLLFLLAVFYPKQIKTPEAPASKFEGAKVYGGPDSDGSKEQKQEHPFIYAILLIALANTHVIMFGFCTALALVFALQCRAGKAVRGHVNGDVEGKVEGHCFGHLLACTAVFAGIFAVAAYLYGSQNENVIVSTYHNALNFENLKNISEKIVFNIDGFSNIFNTSIFWVMTLILGYVLYQKDKKIFFVYISNFLWQFSIFFFVWNILPQRAYAMLLAGLFCFWTVFHLEIKLKHLITILFSLIFLMSVPESFKLIKQEYLSPFSDGKNTAEFIKKNIPQDAFIVSNYPMTTTAVSVYLPKEKWRLWYEGYKNFYTYTVWNKKMPPHYTPLPIAELVKQHKEIYVLMSAGSYYENVKPLYESDKDVIAEKFYIYKFGVKKSGK